MLPLCFGDDHACPARGAERVNLFRPARDIPCRPFGGRCESPDIFLDRSVTVMNSSVISSLAAAACGLPSPQPGCGTVRVRILATLHPARRIQLGYATGTSSATSSLTCLFSPVGESLRWLAVLHDRTDLPP
jgi:hypothetical protein